MIKWTPQKLWIRLHCSECQRSADKQREGLPIQSEGGVHREGGYSLVSVVNQGTGAEKRKQQLWTGWDCFRDRVLHWQKSGKHFTSLTFSESTRFLDTLLQVLPDLQTWYLGRTTTTKCWNHALNGDFTHITERQLQLLSFDFVSRGFLILVSKSIIINISWQLWQNKKKKPY